MSSSKYIVIVDSREAKSAIEVVKWLKRFGCTVIEKQLDIGDYVISKDIVVERKKAMDFINSIIDNRLFEQVSKLKEYYSRPIIIVEGNVWYALSKRNIHPHSVIGALTYLARIRIPIIYTRDEEGTAYAIYSLAKHEYEENRSGIKVLSVKKTASIKELQIKLLSSLPGIGSKRAEKILQVFETPLNALNNVSLWSKKADVPENVVALIRKVLTTKFTEKESEEEIVKPIDEIIKETLSHQSQSSENTKDIKSRDILKYVGNSGSET